MTTSKKCLLFLCTRATKPENKKLSYSIATELVRLGVAEIGVLQNLTQQHSLKASSQRNMIFINDCRSGCVNTLTHGFEQDKFIYIDVSPYVALTSFDIPHFMQNEVLPKLREKWNYSFEALKTNN